MSRFNLRNLVMLIVCVAFAVPRDAAAVPPFVYDNGEEPELILMRHLVAPHLGRILDPSVGTVVAHGIPGKVFLPDASGTFIPFQASMGAMRVSTDLIDHALRVGVPVPGRALYPLLCLACGSGTASESSPSLAGAVSALSSHPGRVIGFGDGVIAARWQDLTATLQGSAARLGLGPRQLGYRAPVYLVVDEATILAYQGGNEVESFAIPFEPPGTAPAGLRGYTVLSRTASVLGIRARGSARLPILWATGKQWQRMMDRMAGAGERAFYMQSGSPTLFGTMRRLTEQGAARGMSRGEVFGRYRSALGLRPRRSSRP